MYCPSLAALSPTSWLPITHDPSHWPSTRDQLALRLVSLSARAQTVPELKELCARLELPKTGTKQDLIDRLARHTGGGFGGKICYLVITE